VAFESIQDNVILDLDRVIAIETRKVRKKEVIILKTEANEFELDPSKLGLIQRIINQKKQDKKQFFGG